MKNFNRLVRVALLVTALASGIGARSDGLSPVRNARAQTAPAFDEGRPVPAAREVPVSASVRRTLPRGAKTLFFVAARLDNRAVLLHGWNTAKGDASLDILAAVPARRSSRTRRNTSSLARLKRINVGRIEPMQIVVRVAPLKAGRGSVIALDWSESQVAFAFMTLPMLAVVLPNGIAGAAIQQDFSTESSAGNNLFYEIRTAPNGEAFLLLRDQSMDAATQRLQRFCWNGRKFERQGEAVTKPL